MAPTALVTGASSGIGLEFANQLATSGHDLVLVARRRDRLEAAAAELVRELGVEVHVIVEDLSVDGAAQRIKAQTDELGLAIGVLINNAGVSGPDLLENREWADHEAFFRLMMLSVAEMCHLYVPGMQERRSGRVVNVASVAGLVTSPGGANYGPAKSYVVALSRELHLIVQGSGVHVTALCPGFTHTEFHDSDRLAEMKAGLPKLIWYSPDVVVREGLAAVERGKPVQVSGRLYRLTLPILKTRLAGFVATKWGRS